MYEVAPAGARAQALLGALVAVIGGCRRAPQHAEIRAAVAPALAPPPVASSPPAVAETPALAPADTRVIEIALGAEFTCARTRGQTVHCWGENNHGQLGDGTTVDRASPARVPLSGVVELGAGSFHACARLTGGTVSCWGMALQGAGATARGESVVHPSTVVGLRGAERLAVGGTSACAFTAEGRVHCWGSFYEPYGNGFFEVPELRGAVHASLEQFFGCFQWQEEGEVRCWSDGYRYHLNGSPRVSKTNGPMTVAGLPSVRRVTTADCRGCRG
jgi:alpha-tubulin suppressor-like RCC1 family protein